MAFWLVATVWKKSVDPQRSGAAHLKCTHRRSVYFSLENLREVIAIR